MADEVIRIRSAEIISGDIVVQFTDGQDVLFRAAFLSQHREQDGNAIIPKGFGDEDDPFSTPLS